MFNLKIFVLLFLFSFQIVSYKSQEVKSTGYYCAGAYQLLECPDNSKIVIEKLINKYTTNECIEYESNLKNFNDNSLDHCVGTVSFDDYARRACNGQQACHLRLNKFHFQVEYSETNCNFTSNIGNVFYSCLPDYETENSNHKTFDICDFYGPEILEDVEEGFIHSPNYPDYYSNNKNCYINIAIPSTKRLVVYLVRRSLEDKSVFNRINDYVMIDNGIKYYGYSNIPQIIYEGNDRESLRIVFKSDWITTSPLQYPKGFLIFFKFYSIEELTTTTIESTTTTTTETPTPTTTTITTEEVLSTSTIITPIQINIQIDDSNKKAAQDLNSISEKMKNTDDKENEKLVTVIAILIGIIGALIVVIFSLLFMYRKKQKQQNNEEDTIYDSNDSRSVSSGNYNEEYQNVSIISTASFNKGMNKSIQRVKSSSQLKSNKFNDRLKRLYNNLNQTLNISTQLLNKESTTNLKKEFNTDSNVTNKTNVYKINEFNPNDIDVKFEKDIPIDKLKLFKTPSINKKNNLEREIEYQSKKEILNQTQNEYVSVQLQKSAPTDSQNEEGKLNIYEVNFENNFAYLTSNGDDKEPANEQDNETEIYQSINEITTDDCKELIDDSICQMNNEENQKASHNTYIGQHANEDDIYSTPTNKQVKEPSKQNNNSVLNLLNETQA